MNGRVSALLPLVLLLVLAAASIWLNRLVQNDNPRGAQRHAADFIVERFKVRRFDPDGRLQHTLIAEKLTHYPDDDTTVVVAPHMTYHQLPPTQIRARTALIGQDGKEIDLVDQVEIIRQGSNGAPATIIRTNAMKIFPDEEKGHADVPVVITRGKSILNGSGLTFDGKTSISVLRGRVTGTIHRNQK